MFTNTTGFTLSATIVRVLWIYPELFAFLALKYLLICVFLKQAKISVYLCLYATLLLNVLKSLTDVELRRWNKVGVGWEDDLGIFGSYS